MAAVAQAPPAMPAASGNSLPRPSSSASTSKPAHPESAPPSKNPSPVAAQRAPPVPIVKEPTPAEDRDEDKNKHKDGANGERESS
ncbi:hypothetical protein IAT38_000513 [Cryptococcus sp. DSM 104549]